MKHTLYLSSGRFKGVLFICIIGFIIGLVLYTQYLVHQLRNESRELVEFYAQFYLRAASQDGNETELNFIFDNIITKTEFPIVYSDSEGNPTAWKGLSVSVNDRSPEAFAKVHKIMQRMAREIKPVALKYGDIPVGYLYYGDSRLITRLVYLPYIEIGIIVLFILIAFFGFTSITRSEQRFIWVGMAKETAHQLGTPISSLMGWIEVLKSTSSMEQVRSLAGDMSHDTIRLEKVAARFSQIGSKTELKKQSAIPILKGVVQYFHRRLPQSRSQVKIIENYCVDENIPINKDLFEWVIENMIKNALDAVKRRSSGAIEIKTGNLEGGGRFYIDIKDNGVGIESKNRKDIFKPGYSTKKRGWGLGLNLAKRIVEEYHHGNLILKETHTGKGTTMRILL